MPDTFTPHHRLLVSAAIGALRLHADVTLSAPWTILFGPSGSGKSSLLRALCGLSQQPATMSFERLDGDSWTPINSLPAHQRCLAYTPQQSNLFPHLTVKQNLIFPTSIRPHGITRSFNSPNRRLIDEAIELFQLAPMLDRAAQSLSGGEQRRVALARAFATPNTRLLLLDEPFSGLDRSLRDSLIHQMKESLQKRGVPVLSVTHDIDEAFVLNPEVIRIEQGQTGEQGPVREVLMQERIRLLDTLNFCSDVERLKDTEEIEQDSKIRLLA